MTSTKQYHRYVRMSTATMIQLPSVGFNIPLARTTLIHHAALHHRLLFWDCPSECDYTCQHIVTEGRVAKFRSEISPVHQFHGKWPFYRFLGMQEPFSVLFSFLNYLAHTWGLSRVRNKIPASYTLRPWYIAFGTFGLVSWTASMVFHTRDYMLTEKADYFAAGASVLYGLYYAPIRIFRLDDPSGSDANKASFVRVWTIMCIGAYLAHVSYLSFWTWDYGYNMTANIVVGVLQNILWSTFAWRRYSQTGRIWQAWPGMIVAWIVFAMSLEILDFVPWRLMIDAHSLWHLGTVVPTIWWYR